MELAHYVAGTAHSYSEPFPKSPESAVCGCHALQEPHYPCRRGLEYVRAVVGDGRIWWSGVASAAAGGELVMGV